MIAGVWAALPILGRPTIIRLLYVFDAVYGTVYGLIFMQLPHLLCPAVIGKGN